MALPIIQTDPTKVVLTILTAHVIASLSLLYRRSTQSVLTSHTHTQYRTIYLHLGQGLLLSANHLLEAASSASAAVVSPTRGLMSST